MRNFLSATRFTWLWLSFGAILVSPLTSKGEVFVLAGGGRLEGELLNPDEAPRQQYVIRTISGAQVTLDAQSVKEVVRRRPEEVEYEKIRPRFPDTVEGQWKLAEWCRENHMSDARDKHLNRIVELDPEHAKARGALGYTRTDGEWKTRAEIMTDRGYVQYKGRWLLPQEIELVEQKRKDELGEKEWFSRLKRYRDWLDGDRAGEALREIANITDPYAVPALDSQLGKEQNANLRKLYVVALAQIGTPSAWQVLSIRSLEDPVEEVRLTCLDYLDDDSRPAVVDFYTGKLRSKDNVMVNRAAIALHRMKDPAAIGPLIDALVTTHKFKVNTNQGGGYNASFSPNGGVGGFSAGGGPKIITRSFQNEPVLTALVSLAGGVSFNYDARAWKRWLSTQKRPESLNARRD